MASGKPKQDKSPTSTSPQQRNRELGILNLTNEAANLTKISDDTLPPLPYIQTGDMCGMPQPCSQGMPLPAMSLEGNVKEFGQCHAIQDSVASENEMTAATHSNDPENSKIEKRVKTTRGDVDEGSEMCKEGEKKNSSDIHGPWQIGKQMIHRVSTPVSSHNLTSGEMGINNNVMMTYADQSIHSQTLYGSCLSRGVESNIENSSKSKVCSRDSTHETNRDILPQLDCFYGKKGDTSSSNPCSKISGGFSSIQNNAGGFISLAQNGGGFAALAQNVDGFSRLLQNLGGVSHQEQNFNEPDNLVQNVGGFFSSAQNMGGFSSQAQNVDRFSSPLQNADQFSRLSQSGDGGISSFLVDNQHYHPFPSNWNLGLGVNKNARFADINPNTGFAGFPTEHLMLHNSNEFGIPDYGQDRGTGLPSSLSLVRSTIQNTTNQLQNPHMGIVRNFASKHSLVASFIGIARSIASQDHSSGQLFQANEACAIQAAGGDLFAQNVGIQPASQEILTASRPAQTSNAPLGPSCKRGATGSPVATLQDQCRKTRKKNSTAGRPAQASSVPLGPYSKRGRKRGATGSPVATVQDQCRKTKETKPSSDASTQNVTQTTLPPTLLAWTAPLSPPPTETGHPHPAQMTAFCPSLAHTTAAQPTLAQSAHPLPAQATPFCPSLDQTVLARPPLAQTTHAHPALSVSFCPYPAQFTPVRSPPVQRAHSLSAQATPFCPPFAQTTPAHPHLAQTALPRTALIASTCLPVAQPNPPHPTLAQIACRLPAWIACTHPPVAPATPACPPQAQTALPCPAPTVPSCPPVAETTPAFPTRAQPACRLPARIARSCPPIAQATRARRPQARTGLPHPALAAPSCPPVAQTTLGHPPLAHTAPPSPPLPTTAAPLRIKWQDPDKTPQPSGQLCQLCMMDLSYSPEETMYQTANPPPVAVLPCHHHFHAYCLELITTEDQAQNPPCIPCALSDSNQLSS